MRQRNPHSENRDRRRKFAETRRTMDNKEDRSTMNRIVEAMKALAAMGDDMLERFKTPWSEGVWSYATDNRAAIRAERLEEFADRPDNPGANIDTLVNFPAGPTWYDIPALPAAPVPETCPRCDGTRRIECHACESTGTAIFELWANGIRYTVDGTCPVCHGKCGNCRNCYGAGTITPEEAPIEIGPAIFNPAYLRIMATLPGCQIAPVDSRTAAVFRFDGGRGAVMPIRR